MPQAGHTATRLHDGRVLVAGDSSTELYVDSPAQLCFPADQTICASGRFLAYWQAHGGLAINGYPISDEFTEVLEDGKAYTVQYFERVRMEYHPENAGRPTTCCSASSGDGSTRPTPPAPRRARHHLLRARPGTTSAARFRAYWEANGGLAQFGYPLTEEFTETLEDGKALHRAVLRAGALRVPPREPEALRRAARPVRAPNLERALSTNQPTVSRTRMECGGV